VNEILQCKGPESPGCTCGEPGSETACAPACTGTESPACTCTSKKPDSTGYPAYNKHRFTLPKEYLSASQINMLQRCPKQYEFRYVEGLIVPPNAALLIGKGVHSGHETYFQMILDRQQPLLPLQVAEFAISEMEAEAEEKDIPFDGPEKDEVIQIVQNAVIPYITHVAPLVTPLAVEQELRYTSRCGVDLLGFMDLLRAENDYEVKAGQPAGARIVDYKVTAKKWAVNKLINDLQFNLYGLATGIRQIEIHNLVKTATKSKVNKQVAADYTAPTQDVASNIRIIRNEFGTEENDHFEGIIEDAARQISSGIFPRCAPDAWCCNADWCGYWKMCRGKRT
jgi:hypothetical protein